MSASSLALVFWFILFAAGLALMLYTASGVRADKLEATLERIGQRVGEAGLRAVFTVMRIDSPAAQAKAGSYYSDIEARRHEQLPVLSSSVLDDERVLFLHEMEFGARTNFLSVEGHTVRVNRKQAKRIEELLLFHDAYGNNMAKVFMQYGYVLEII